jgi:hypothetical protein
MTIQEAVDEYRAALKAERDAHAAMKKASLASDDARETFSAAGRRACVAMCAIGAAVEASISAEEALN